MDEQFHHSSRPNATDKQLTEILRLTGNLESNNRMPDEYDVSHHFFRKYIHQQFIYQKPLSFQEIGRQFILFGDIEENHKIRIKFQKKHNIDINHFLMLSLATAVNFHNSTSLNVNNHWYSSLSPALTKNLPDFFNSTSKTITKLRDSLTETQPAQRRASEFYEHTPLINTPFLLLNNSYWIPHRQIFFRGIENFIYNTLSEDSLEEFNSLFTKKFEQHVESIISSLNLPYATEKQLLQRKRSGKVVDFLISDESNNARISVEAKCVSASNNLMLNDGSMEILRATKANIAKATKQCIEFNNWLNKNHDTKPKNPHRDFAIIITYGELQVINAEHFSYLTNEMLSKSLREKYGDDIELERIFFASIGEFEALVKCHIEGISPISETLARILESQKNANAGNKRMAIGQYLFEWEMDQGSHPIIVDRFSKEVENLRAHMKC
ncbi:hypothetical protein HCU74_17075 [Spongiibacter sp. KMU-166]|uniref:DUF4263 domain-containing protein n=2 Tax=Spongiibacter thalassae TaxID=2721624 RepID=A0ABX1GIU9_9GAMM|nr:hypothetical protein [Spongiibacter thalassae]NKI19123.1 hypothetical protein [Spongiibacter thalassae]